MDSSHVFPFNVHSICCERYHTTQAFLTVLSLKDIFIEMITMGINFMISVRHWVLVWFGISLVCGETYSSAACKEQELVCNWNELVAPENFLYVQKYALYERLKLVNASSDYSVTLYEQNSHEMPFSISHFCNNQKQSFPMEHYMFVMRLYYAKELEIERLWSLSPNSSELKSTIISFSSEYSVLTITGDRLIELAEDEDTLVGDSDESLQSSRDYVETLSVVVRLAQDLLRFVEKDYISQCIETNVTEVESDFFFKQQQVMISDIITYHIRHMGYPPEVAEKWNLIPLLYTHISQSIVPFINHILTTQLNSKLQAVPTLLVNQMSSYVVGKETFSSRLLVTDRQYNNVTFYSSILNGETSTAAGTAAEWDTVTLSHSLRMIFAVVEDVDVEKMLNNVNGYGSCTIAHLECLHYTTLDNSVTLSEYSEEKKNDIAQSVASRTVNQEFCMSTKNVQIYNTVVVSPILSLLDRAERPIYTDISAKHHRAMDTPLHTFMQLSGNNVTEAVQKAINYERSLLYHDHNYCPQGDETPKILILGLAAGELHNFLLRYFPCIFVRSVDINLDMFLIAQKYFGFGNSVCSAKVYNSTVNEMMDIETTMQNNNVQVKEHIREIPGALDCRSEVIISDAWEYINYQVTRNRYCNDPITSQHITPYDIRTNTVLYDMIMFDVYDMLAASWHGEADSGESSPFVDRAASDASLTAVRDLLKPSVGIAVFHLHRDGQFSYYYNQIRKIFGSDQVVLFTVSGNDAMVVAGRDVYESETNLTEEQQVEEPQCFGEGEEKVCESPPNSNVVIYKPIAHPCKEPLLFANHASWLAEFWGFREETVYASKYSLNCVDYWDD